MMDAVADIYVGLDTSQSTTAICAIGVSDVPILETVVPTGPATIALALEALPSRPKVIGLEAAGQSEWLAGGLRALGFNILVLEAVRVRRYAAVAPIKSDRTDAQIIARLLKGQLYREVHVKSPEARAARTLLVQREAAMVSMRGCKNAIRGALRAHGIVLPLRADAKFAQRVRESTSADGPLATILAPQLDLWELHRSIVSAYDQQVHRLAKSNDIIRLLQTMPEVGELVATAFWCTIDNPWRFREAQDVGAYIGLTPFLYQSGDYRKRGGISRHGDRLLRGLLFMGARTAMFNSRESTDLLVWAAGVRARRGPKRAVVALARRMSVVLLHMWRNNQEYRPSYKAEGPGGVSLC
jgi:transposase